MRGIATLLLAGIVGVTAACGDPLIGVDTLPPTRSHDFEFPQVDPPLSDAPDVQMCVEGEVVMVSWSDAQELLAQGAYTGLCNYTISFLAAEDFVGVDRIEELSTNDATAYLSGPYLTLRDSSAVITGYRRGSTQRLSHRGTRGLGVLCGREADEIDASESMEISFSSTHRIREMEIRSLFTGEQAPGTEEGDIYFYRDNQLIHVEHVVGTQLAGTNGTVWIDFREMEPLVDLIVLTVEEGNDYSSMSEFALANIVVQPQE